jgi:flagellar assembly protein FliH
MEKMNMSSSAEIESLFSVPITAVEYRDMAGHAISDVSAKAGVRISNGGRRRAVELSEEELAAKIQLEVANATRETELRLRQEFEAKLETARAPIAATVAAFDAQRTEYYARVEAEVVQLALAIAAKILHREAQVDPMLVAALVRMTIEKMREGSSVTVRVGPGQGRRWKDYFASKASVARVDVVEDAGLTDHDCLLETELGIANFGLDTQLKEVEQGFFDLLALRPENR